MTHREQEQEATPYEVLQVHPSAPAHLLSAAYWCLVDHSFRQRNGQEKDRLHRLTEAYQTLANPRSREEYDSRHGVQPAPRAPSIPDARSRRRWLFALRRKRQSTPEDDKLSYYELLRVDPKALPEIIRHARPIVRDYYLAAVARGEVTPQILDRLEEAYSVLSDPVRRAEYDATAAHIQLAVPEPEPIVPPVETPPSRSPAEKEESGGSKKAEQRRQREAAVVPKRERRKTGKPLAKPRPFSLRPFRRWPSAPKNGAKMSGFAAVAGTLRRLLPSVAEGSMQLAEAGGEEAVLQRLASRGQTSFVAGPDSGGHSLAALHIQTPGEEGQTVEVGRQALAIGSGESCDIRLEAVAPLQARLWCVDGSFLICNLAEKPELTVNGRVTTWALLDEGDILRIGPHEIRVLLASSQAAHLVDL
ncbi:MAG TPA: hypothetical protein VNL15_01175 [Dehalococcoidia bacterium]|nr:hypothetical protein [Dehalococcoidia bacterium]